MACHSLGTISVHNILCLSTERQPSISRPIVLNMSLLVSHLHLCLVRVAAVYDQLTGSVSPSCQYSTLY